MGNIFLPAAFPVLTATTATGIILTPMPDGDGTAIIYELLEHWDINALIDINGRAKSSENAPDGVTFDKQGHPLCRAGHKMCPWGNDPVKDAHKYRCPLKCGRIASCPYEETCSPGSYGRTVYIKNHGDLHFQPRIPRDSEQYRKILSVYASIWMPDTEPDSCKTGTRSKYHLYPVYQKSFMAGFFSHVVFSVWQFPADELN